VSDIAGGPRRSIVLVDDSSEVRALVRRRLESSGFDVVAEGADGDEAILLAYRHAPALLLLDTSMPKADGIEALPAILALSPETKVVMFTGFEEPGLAARARELGAADFVEKSIRLEDLPERLLRILDVGRPVGSRLGSRPGSGDGPAAIGSSPPLREETFDQEQAVLSQHVQQFRELFDRAEVGMATLTSSGTVVRANGALAGLMSCAPDDLVGVDYGRLTVGKGDELDRRLKDISTLGEDLTSFEHYLPAPVGEEPTRIVRATLAPIRDARGQVLYVFAQVHDVTSQRAVESDLRRSEENFRRLVTAVVEYAIFLLDVEGKVVSWNSGARRIKGYDAHEIVGRHFRVFYPPEEQQAGHPEHNLEAALRVGSFAEEGWRLRKDGSRFWASVVISPVYDDGGSHIGFAKVTRDLSEQREHEEERRRFLEQRVHLLSVTAHELRTPTAVIDGSAVALLAEWEGMSVAERDELLGGIRTSADRLRRLAGDLGTASRVYGETLELQLADMSLTEAVRGAMTRGLVAGFDVPILVDVPQEAVLHADAVRLGQAIDNLLDNAVRHGSPPIRLTGIVDDEVVRIRVSDAGPGVPAELVPHLFERFAIAGSTGATGLGLYIVREIARGHGGEAAYHPRTRGEPATFEIGLPRVSS
jgi:PAS domain S-box-containing protein